MGLRKVFSSVLVGVIIAGSIGISASAVEIKQEVLTDRVMEMEITRATGSFRAVTLSLNPENTEDSWQVYNYVSFNF